MVVKSRTNDDLVVNLQKMFNNHRKYHMKLNPEKYTIRVPSGKLLRFLVSNQEIEVNPDKIIAIDRMKSLTRRKKVQKLTGCVAALSRFISRLGEKGLSLFKLLKKSDNFLRIPGMGATFQDLNR